MNETPNNTVQTVTEAVQGSATVITPKLLEYIDDTSQALADPFELLDPDIQDLVHLVHVVREGHQVVETIIDRERYLPNPLRRTGAVDLLDIDSLITYTVRHFTTSSVAYLIPGSGGSATRFAVIFDDHDRLTTPGVELAGWRSHRATAILAATREWQRWAEVDGRMLAQSTFAEIVDDGMAQIVSPPAAELREMAQTLSGGAQVSWRNSQRLDNGETEIQWVETIEGRAGKDGKLTIPSHIKVRVRPWSGGPTVELVGRFRWRKPSAGQLTMGVMFDDIEGVLEEALKVEAAKFTAATTVPVLWAESIPAPIKGTRG